MSTATPGWDEVDSAELKFTVEMDEGEPMFCACAFDESGTVLVGWSAASLPELFTLIGNSYARIASVRPGT